MANNYDQLPRVEFEVNLADFKRLERIARTLEAAGLQGAYAEFQREYANAFTGQQTVYPQCWGR